MKPLIALLLVVIAAGSIQSQDAALTFEVASIKPNQSVSGERGLGFQPRGRFTARNVRVW